MTNETINEKSVCEGRKDITLRELMELWMNKEVIPGNLSNGTVMTYRSVINRISVADIYEMKISEIGTEQLQNYFDSLSECKSRKNKYLSSGYIKIFRAVLCGVFKFAVFPEKLISSDPMQYVRISRAGDTMAVYDFAGAGQYDDVTITHKQYKDIVRYLSEKNNPALLPVQIAYYTGLRLGEVCALLWRDIDLDNQCITVRRSMRYNSIRHITEIGMPKRNKTRKVDFGNKLLEILKCEKVRQEMFAGNKYCFSNYFKKIKENGREHYDVYSFANSEKVPEDFHRLSLVCLRSDGKFERPDTVSIMCRSVRKIDDSLYGFHFHALRHTYTCNLLAAGAAPKDVQELLGHSDISTTMNIYAHSNRKNKRKTVMLLDKL